MISIHGVNSIRAETISGCSWVKLVFSGVNERTEITLFLDQPRKLGEIPVEDPETCAALVAAINQLFPRRRR